jgi:propanol-preferring alcohol dehydrogenase
MKALRLLEWKHEPELVDVDDPTPGPGEVVVEVAGAGACHSDLHLMHDFEPGLLPWGPPFTLGHENAGRVAAIGAGVDTVAEGDAVAVYGAWGCGQCRHCMLGMENYCQRPDLQAASGGGLGFDGGMARYMLVPKQRWLVPLGDLDPVVAAPLTDAGLTPYHAVKRSLPKLVPGSTAVAIGVGGLGHMGVQFLKQLSPARVIAVDQRQEALDLAASIGADHTVMSGPDAAAEITELTKGANAEAVLDFVGVDATLALAAAVARPYGDLTIVGIGGGSLPIGFFSIGYEVAVATTYWGSRPELVETLALAEAGKIHITATHYPLDQAMQAYRDLAAGSVDGRAVITPGR